MGDRVHIAAPFTKVTPTEDGGREVWGFATLEVKDKQGEIIDYEGTVRAFEKWTGEIERATGGKSLGNIRWMHQAEPVGKLIAWRPEEKTTEDGDTVRGVYIGTRVPPWETRTIGQLDEGILTGYSIGGGYAERHWDPAAKAFRYTPELAETSYVDNPAVPGAAFDLVRLHKGALEVNPALLKADGKKDDEREKVREAAEERAKKYGIALHEADGGNLTPPKGYPENEDDYGDPVNFKYPIDAKHIVPAVEYFNHADAREKGGYSVEEWAKIGKRIAERANKDIGDGHSFKDGKIAVDEEEERKREEAEKAAVAAAMQKAAKGDDLSHGDRRRLVCAALRDKAGPMDDPFWPEEMFDSHAIVHDWNSDKYYRVPYELKEGKAVLGDPQEVRHSWEPVKEAEKGMTDEELRKVADMVAERLAKAGKAETTEERDAREGAEKDPDPDDDGDEDKEDAEKASQAAALLKGVVSRLGKASDGKRVPRRKHLMHAIDHIHRALGNEDEIKDKDHLDGKGDDDERTEKMVSAIVAKLGPIGSMAKGDLLKAAVTEAVAAAGLAKASDVSALAEGLAKAASDIEAVKGDVKAIAEQPTPGPYLGAMPGLGGANPWGAQVEDEALAGYMTRTNDPVVKDAIGRELATRAARAALRRPTP